MMAYFIVLTIALVAFNVWAAYSITGMLLEIDKRIQAIEKKIGK
jgi:hypothetical protein